MQLDRAMVQTTYTTVMQHFIDHGRAPHYTKLAMMLGTDLPHAKALLHQAAKVGVGCWMAHDTDLVESWAPFHNIPTHYQVTINGEQKWYGQ